MLACESRCGHPHSGNGRGAGRVCKDMPVASLVTFRPIESGDKRALASFFANLSDESRRRRFLGPKPRLTDRDLAFLTEVDQRRHVAIVALDAEGAIVGVGRYACWPGEPDRAELAFAVVDAWHGRGLGTALGERLVAHARGNGIATLTASTLALNAPAKALLQRLGFQPTGIASGVAEYVLPLRAALPAAA